MGKQYVAGGFSIYYDRNIGIIFINTLLTKTDILIYKYFVDENKYIMEGVAMFSLFKILK